MSAPYVLISVLAALCCGATAFAQAEAAPPTFTLSAGQRVPLTVIKGVSTKTAAPGDPVYLSTTFPVLSGRRIVIPVGSYVTGTITDSKRAGKVKGRAELRMRMEQIILPNGVTHDFRGSLSNLESANGETLDREEGTVVGKRSIGDDANTVYTVGRLGGMAGGAAGGLATIGTTSDPNASNWSLIRRPVIGSAAGMAGGMAAGLIVTLMTRGADAALVKGADLEMTLDRPVTFEDVDLAGLPAPPPGARQPDPSGLKQR